MIYENDRVVFKVNNNYYFWDGRDDADFYDAYPDAEIIGYVPYDRSKGHMYHESWAREDLNQKGQKDHIREYDYKIPEGKYVVCYYEDLESCYQKVDYNITKEDIIRNILDQKYKDGANYYLMEELERENKKYRLTYVIVIDVFAKNEDEAIEKADQIWSEGKFELFPTITEEE